MVTLRRWTTGVAPSAALLAVAVIAGAASFDPAPMLRWSQEGATAWLSLELDGTVALLDSSVPGQAAIDIVEVAEPGSDLDVHQVDGDALVLNRSTGAIRWVDAATREVGPRLQVLDGGDRTGDAQLVSGLNGDAWVVSAAEARRIDTSSTAAVGPGVDLPADIGSHRIVDGHGDLWLNSGSDVVSSASDFRPVAGYSGPIGLGLLAGTPVALDIDGDRLDFLDGGRTCEVSVSDGAQVHETLTVALVSDPASAMAYLIGDDCKTIPIEGLVDASAVIVDAVEVDGWVYLADLTSQQVLMAEIADPGVDSNRRTDRLSPDGTNLIELIAVGATVFYDQPESGAAGVVDRRAPGGIYPLEKSAPTGYRCEASTLLAVVGEPVTLRAVAIDDGEVLASARWAEVGDSPGDEGPEFEIPTDVEGVANYHFLTPDDRRVQCNPVVISEELTAGIIDLNPGVKEIGETGRFSSATSNPDDAYRWSIAAGPATIVDDETEQVVSVRFDGAGTVSLRLELSRNGRSDDETFLVSVFQPQQRGNEVAGPGIVASQGGVDPSGATDTELATGTTDPDESTDLDVAIPVEIEGRPRLVSVGSTSFRIEYRTNVCGTGSFTVRKSTGEVVGRHQGDAGCWVQHGALSHWAASEPLEPGTTYIVDIDVRGQPSDGTERAGSGTDSFLGIRVTTEEEDPDPDPAGDSQIRILRAPYLTYVGETSFHFNFVSNDVCAVSGVAVSNRATGESWSFDHSPTGSCGNLHGTFVGQGNHGAIRIEPGTTYDVTTYLVPRASDGNWPAGEGRPSATFAVTTPGGSETVPSFDSTTSTSVDDPVTIPDLTTSTLPDDPVTTPDPTTTDVPETPLTTATTTPLGSAVDGPTTPADGEGSG